MGEKKRGICQTYQMLQVEELSQLECVCKYLLSARAGSRAYIRHRWQFNWAVMATLVPTTSLQPYDPRSFIGNSEAPGARTEICKQVFMTSPL